MHAESDCIPVSALQHYAFCPRQCALIHVEGQWGENRLTAEGRQLHERAHEADNELRGEVLVVRDLALRSLHHGLTGKADVVEFRRERTDAAGAANPAQEGDSPKAAPLPGRDGLWRPFPVEYKRGKPKPGDCDTVQLCAQALCLEEMLGVTIPTGALFYGRTRRRLDVAFTNPLRRRTVEVAAAVHRLADRGETPPAQYASRCRQCSLVDICMPKATSGRSARRWLTRMMAAACDDTDNPVDDDSLEDKA